jgi:hypothetical protein
MDKKGGKRRKGSGKGRKISEEKRGKHRYEQLLIGDTS